MRGELLFGLSAATPHEREDRHNHDNSSSYSDDRIGDEVRGRRGNRGRWLEVCPSYVDPSVHCCDCGMKGALGGVDAVLVEGVCEALAWV
jgi:hypothetical protein